MSESRAYQFHDGAIVYLSKRPFVVVIMTEGSKIELLPGAIAQLSAVCYEFMSNLK